MSDDNKHIEELDIFSGRGLDDILASETQQYNDSCLALERLKEIALETERHLKTGNIKESHEGKSVRLLEILERLDDGLAALQPVTTAKYSQIAEMEMDLINSERLTADEAVVILSTAEKVDDMYDTLEKIQKENNRKQLERLIQINEMKKKKELEEKREEERRMERRRYGYD